MPFAVVMLLGILASSILKKDNGGLSDARHIGIRQAKGAYVTYVDAEDWVEPTYLEGAL